MPNVDLPRHLERDITIDARLTEMAREAVAHYIRTQDPTRGCESEKWAVKPSQIKGLRQVACTQPERLGDFVGKQLEKARARTEDRETKPSDKDQQVIAFWTLILEALRDPPQHTWAISQVRSEAMPDHLRQKDPPKGAKLSREQQEARRIQKQERERWERQWNAEHIPPYFRSFCIEYLYQMYNV